MLSWVFQHDYLDTYCFECLICMCFVFLYLHLFSAISMFHMERRSRNTLIITTIIFIIITIIIIIVVIIICILVKTTQTTTRTSTISNVFNHTIGTLNNVQNPVTTWANNTSISVQFNTLTKNLFSKVSFFLF